MEVGAHRWTTFFVDDVTKSKVVVGESVARQHRMVVCRTTLVVRKMKRTNTNQRTKWWKLKKEECCVVFRGIETDSGWSGGASR